MLNAKFRANCTTALLDQETKRQYLNDFFNQVGMRDDGFGRDIKFDIPMGSMVELKEGDLQNWKSPLTDYVVSEKLDGGKILSQGLFAVDWTCDIGLIYDKVFKLGCYILLNTLLFLANINPTPPKRKHLAIGKIAFGG